MRQSERAKARAAAVERILVEARRLADYPDDELFLWGVDRLREALEKYDAIAGKGSK